MRCRKAERLLSDDLDGALDRAGKTRLEAHVRACPDCRAYRGALARLREAVGPPEERPAEYWSGFERRLEARLDREPGGRGLAAAPSPGRRALAWAAASASFLVILAAVWYGLVRKGAEEQVAWTHSGDPLASPYLGIETDPELALAVDREIRASIDEMAPAMDADALVFRAADPLFWDGLSEEELGAIAAGLEQENGLGGPK